MPDWVVWSLIAAAFAVGEIFTLSFFLGPIALAARDDVSAVRYPGLPADPSHEVAARQMTRFGSVLAFDVGSRARAEAFFEAAELVTAATSFGGAHTTGERRGRWPGNDVSEGFIRLSAGIEDTDDLVADVERALDRTS